MRINFRYIIPFFLFLFISGCGQERPQPEVRNIEETSLPIVSKEPERTEISGTYDNVNWTLSKDYILTIGGTGKIDYEELFYSIKTEISQVHWDFEDAEDVKQIIIKDGITELGRLCFEHCVSLEKVEMSDSVQKIGKSAFSECWKLKEIRLSPNITQIGRDAFLNCRSLKKIELPEKLEKYHKDAIWGCTALEEIENRSAHPWKLATKRVAGRWFCDGKEVEELPPGKTASIRSIKYQITYNLSGGVATGKLPSSYDSREGCKIPKTVKRKGWSLVNWHIKGDDGYDDAIGDLKDTIEPGEEGIRKITALWIRFQLNKMKNGKIRANIEMEPFGEKLEYHCAIRYSQHKDMSDYEVLIPYSDEYDRDGVLRKMKKGKHYYVEFAICEGGLDECLDEDETLDDLPWRWKREVTCG